MTTPQSSSTEPYVGQDLGEWEFTPGEHRIASYYAGLELRGPAGRDFAPCMLANRADAGGRVLLSNHFGHLWLRQEWEFQRPMTAATTYRASGRVADIYPRGERTILLTETTLRTPEGELVSVQRHHQSFLGQQGGELKLRDPKAKEGARTFAVPEGRELTPIERTISLEMCGEYFQGNRNYHTDRKESVSLGFRDVVVGGTMTMAYVGELLEREFGAEWQQSGSLIVKFTNVVWANETVRARCVVTGADGDFSPGVFAWVEKADGAIAVVATGGLRE